MEQLELLKIPEPCRGVCQSDSKGYCLGCMRNRQERFEWQHYTPGQKLYVLKLCRRRFIRRKQLAQQQNAPQISSDTDQDTSQFDLPL